jgi:hypothetical protein
MRFWVREVAGWLLVLIGLYVFWACFAMLADYRREPRIIEVGPLVFIGFVIFRGGIHLLKVAVAARVCLHAQKALEQNPSVRGRPAAGVRDPRAQRLRVPPGR